MTLKRPTSGPTSSLLSHPGSPPVLVAVLAVAILVAGVVRLGVGIGDPNAAPCTTWHLAVRTARADGITPRVVGLVVKTGEQAGGALAAEVTTVLDLLSNPAPPPAPLQAAVNRVDATCAGVGAP